jgi:hypothetical protein
MEKKKKCRKLKSEGFTPSEALINAARNASNS